MTPQKGNTRLDATQILYQNEANYVYKNVFNDVPIERMYKIGKKKSSVNQAKSVKFQTKDEEQVYSPREPPSQVKRSQDRKLVTAHEESNMNQVELGEPEIKIEEIREEQTNFDDMNPYDTMVRQFSGTLAREMEDCPEGNFLNWSINTVEMEYPHSGKGKVTYQENTEEFHTKTDTPQLIEHFENYSIANKNPEDKFEDIRFSLKESLFYDDNRDVGTTVLGQIGSSIKSIHREELSKN